MNCIETQSLTHAFSEKEKVVNDVSLQVPEGSIYGFLGPNGAGKTTTLKLILGLLKKQQGAITIFGKTFEAERIEILRRTGSLIESPSLYPQLTARENLALLQKVYQCPKKRIDEVLEIVDLASTGKKKSGQFSLGMKQRLSIAIALLHNPALMILDEPTNGLDPKGIIEVRELLKQLNRDHGLTILISSHLLSEIEKLVTHVGIINHGRLLFQGTLPALQAKQTESAVIRIETSDNAKAGTLLREKGLSPSLSETHLTLPMLEREEVASLNQLLVTNGLRVYQLSSEKSDLEAIFMNLTNN
jgi:lantibiotic transport system ATP-binding protein